MHAEMKAGKCNEIYPFQYQKELKPDIRWQRGYSYYVWWAFNSGCYVIAEALDSKGALTFHTLGESVTK